MAAWTIPKISASARNSPLPEKHFRNSNSPGPAAKSSVRCNHFGYSSVLARVNLKPLRSLLMLPKPWPVRVWFQWICRSVWKDSVTLGVTFASKLGREMRRGKSTAAILIRSGFASRADETCYLFRIMKGGTMANEVPEQGTIRYVRCPTCGAPNPGTLAVCARCGNPMQPAWGPASAQKVEIA